MEANNEIVWIMNTQPRVFHLPDDVKRVRSPLPGGGEMSTATISQGNGKPLAPSAPRERDGQPQANAIDRVYWDRVKGNKQVQVWLRKGWISVSEAPPSGDPTEIDSLAKFNARTARDLISGEENSKLLADWLKTETRGDVKDAIETRMAELASRKPQKLPPLK